ncbi:MAG: 60S ribosomal protein L22 [Candidatus Bathyarchaeia archaeon]
MSEIRIDISELKAEGDEVIKDLADFLSEKTSIETEKTTNEIIVKTDERKVSKQYLRMLLRKFLHKVGLKDYFRVIGGKENTLIIKERKISEIEE